VLGLLWRCKKKHIIKKYSRILYIYIYNETKKNENAFRNHFTRSCRVATPRRDGVYHYGATSASHRTKRNEKQFENSVLSTPQAARGLHEPRTRRIFTITFRFRTAASGSNFVPGASPVLFVRTGHLTVLTFIISIFSKSKFPDNFTFNLDTNNTYRSIRVESISPSPE